MKMIIKKRECLDINQRVLWRPIIWSVKYYLAGTQLLIADLIFFIAKTEPILIKIRIIEIVERSYETPTIRFISHNIKPTPTSFCAVNYGPDFCWFNSHL